MTKRRANGRFLQDHEHGTWGGYCWHKRRQRIDPTHEVCDRCDRASDNRSWWRRAERRMLRETEHDALWTLARRHPDEYANLLLQKRKTFVSRLRRDNPERFSA